MIKIDLISTEIDVENVDVSVAHKKLRDINAENDNVWINLPNLITDCDIDRILKTADDIRQNFDVLFVVGVGGSFAGAFAGLNWFGSDFDVEFLGTSFDPSVTKKALEKWSGKRICANVISKSGTTLEITSVLEVIKPFVKRVIITGAMEGRDFEILDGVGGRYSALCAVGYLPMAVMGVDIKAMNNGARVAFEDLKKEDNEAYKYAKARYLLHNAINSDCSCNGGCNFTGKSVEILASFCEGLEGLGKWWQQLFGESEGKDGKGLLPVPLVYSRDLHSMGQFVQQGSQIFFETLISIKNPPLHSELNTAAFKGTVKAHADAGVPVVIIEVEKLDAFGFGYLIYFFEIACAMSALLLGVNPFNQPGVEFYKKHMREELDK